MLRAISARIDARDLHTIAPGPLQCTVGDGSRRSEAVVEKKSRIAPLNAIIIIIIIIIMLFVSVSAKHPSNRQSLSQEPVKKTILFDATLAYALHIKLLSRPVTVN